MELPTLSSDFVFEQNRFVISIYNYVRKVKSIFIYFFVYKYQFVEFSVEQYLMDKITFVLKTSSIFFFSCLKNEYFFAVKSSNESNIIWAWHEAAASAPALCSFTLGFHSNLIFKCPLYINETKIEKKKN